MRRAPIGTGPFKFVEYKGNQGIKVTRNPNYWKPGRPYLDGIEYTIIPNRSTAILAFVAGNFDMIFPYELTVPLVADVQKQMPDAVCDISPMNVAANILMNPVPPFDDLDVRRAVAMSLDRKAFVDILTQGKGDIGTAMQPLPEGRWGMPEAMQRELPGYDPDVAKSREKARAIMTAHGYGPDKRLKLKLSTRNLPTYRDASVILISQLKEIFIDAELDLVETAIWVPKLIRREYQMAVSQVGNGVDDPDQGYPENYACGSRTYMDYCNKEIDAPDRQAVGRAGPGEAQADRLGDRPQADPGCGAPDALLHARRHLLAARGEERDRHDQQHLQWLAHGGCLAGAVRRRGCHPGACHRDPARPCSLADDWMPGTRDVSRPA